MVAPVIGIRPLAAAALALMLPGCLLLDGREELKLSPPGTLYASEGVRLRANGQCEEVAIEIDGRDAGTVPANADVYVPLGPLALSDGPHRLVARARDGMLAGSKVEATIEVDTREFALVDIAPSPGLADADPFTATFTFSRRIETFSPPSASIERNGGSSRSTATSVSADRRSITVALDGMVEDGEPSSLLVLVTPAGAAGGVAVRGGPWRAPAFTVDVSAPAPGALATGPMHFTATAVGELPSAAELWAGDRLITALGPPPWDVEFDPRTLPDGLWQLAVRAAGSYVHGTFPSIRVDFTPPTVVSCSPEESPPDQASAAECIRVVFSEFVTGATQDARLMVGGSPRETRVDFGTGVTASLRLCPTQPLPIAALPAIETVFLPVLRDWNGNALEPFTCAMTIPAWRAPFGPSAADDTAEVAFPLLDCAGKLLAIPRPGASGAGRVQAWSPAPSGGWMVDGALSVESGSVASDLSSAAWIERIGAGPGRVYPCHGSGAALNADTGRDARHPSGDDFGYRVAWSEEDASGGRIVRMRHWSSALGWSPVPSPPRLSAGSVADYPAACEGALASGGYVTDLAAWIEAEPGGVARLRGASHVAGVWTDVSEIGNVDPSQPASEPTVRIEDHFHRNVVAWREGAAVMARIRDGATWTSPAMLNRDPVRAARLPRPARYLQPDLVLYWVEETPSGDEIWARQWNGTSWELLPGPVNAGTEGTRIVGLDAASWNVTWVDDAGIVRVRSRGW
jgi:hypothetical protein